jgi:hypothetical protein
MARGSWVCELSKELLFRRYLGKFNVPVEVEARIVDYFTEQ